MIIRDLGVVYYIILVYDVRGKCRMGVVRSVAAYVFLFEWKRFKGDKGRVGNVEGERGIYDR